MSRLTAAQQRKQQFAVIQAALRLAFDGLVRRYGLGQSLGNICQKIGSGSTPRGGDNVYVSEGIPFIRSLNVRHFAFQHEDLAKIPPDVDAMMKGTRVLGGDVLLNITGASIGRSCCAPFDICPANVSQHVCIIRPEPDLYSARFVMYWLNCDAMQRQINEIQKGATRQGLTKKQIEGFRLPAVPTTEQKTLEGLFESILAGVMVSPSDFPEHLRRLYPQINKVQNLANKCEEAQETTANIQNQAQRLLAATFHRLIQGIPRRRLGDIAPLNRRPASIDHFQEYPQVSVRSFGRGTFHNPPLNGSEITWEKPHLVMAGDILISNIKAWEGAIAVAKPEDDGRFGSHRYLTYVPVPGVATARFLCFFLLSPEGLYHVGEASPGSADRNRTTSAKGLAEIPVPLPSYAHQMWFGELYDKVEVIKELHTQTTTGRSAMLPAILDRAFRGEL